MHRCPAQIGTVQTENGRNPGAARRLHLTFAYSSGLLSHFIYSYFYIFEIVTSLPPHASDPTYIFLIWSRGLQK